MTASTEQISNNLGALEASLTYFAGEDFDDLLFQLMENLELWLINHWETPAVGRLGARLLSVLRQTNGSIALLTQSNVALAFMRAVQDQVFHLEMQLRYAGDTHETIQAFLNETRDCRHDLTQIVTSYIAQVDALSTLDVAIDLASYKTLKSRVQNLQLVDTILHLDPLERYFEFPDDLIASLASQSEIQALQRVANAFDVVKQPKPDRLVRAIEAFHAAELR
jgi:hypothetical protein